jgi:hypothetical protein
MKLKSYSGCGSALIESIRIHKIIEWIQCGSGSTILINGIGVLGKKNLTAQAAIHYTAFAMRYLTNAQIGVLAQTKHVP